MKEILYSPPVVFLLLVAVLGAASLLLSRYSVRGEAASGRALDAYTCGQRGFKDYINPNYDRFFSFAFVFTVMHVLTMVVATAPKRLALMPVIYILSGILVLIIAFRR